MNAAVTASTLIVINEQITDPDDERDHITCCEDENVGLCGVDLTGVPWVTDDAGKNCTDCHRIEREDLALSDEVCLLCPLSAFDGAAS